MSSEVDKLLHQIEHRIPGAVSLLENYLRDNHEPETIENVYQAAHLLNVRFNSALAKPLLRLILPYIDLNERRNNVFRDFDLPETRGEKILRDFSPWSDQIVPDLIQYGWNINLPMASGHSFVYERSFDYNPELFFFLVDNGAKPNSKDLAAERKSDLFKANFIKFSSDMSLYSPKKRAAIKTIFTLRNTNTIWSAIPNELMMLIITNM